MKKDELLIQDVTLAEFEGYGELLSYYACDKEITTRRAKFEISKTVTCIVDYEHNKVIDIETCYVWDIVTRDKYGNLTCDLVEGKLYPLLFTSKDWNTTSYLSQLSIKARAKKIYESYLNDLEKSESNMKTLKRKEN